MAVIDFDEPHVYMQERIAELVEEYERVTGKSAMSFVARAASNDIDELALAHEEMMAEIAEAKRANPELAKQPIVQKVSGASYSGDGGGVFLVMGALAVAVYYFWPK